MSNIDDKLNEVLGIAEVDKTYEKKAFIFPAALQHSVYPFYGTDEYRITVSGNLAFTKVSKGDLW